LEYLVVGSPTRGFRPTEGITTFLKGIPEGRLNGAKVAAFDTRIAPEDIKSRILRFLVKIGGYAAPSIAKRLEQAGGRLIVPPEGFAVTGTEGPMKQGELERAAEWARGCRRIQRAVACSWGSLAFCGEVQRLGCMRSETGDRNE